MLISSFCLFGNILVDELIIIFRVSLFTSVVPVPVMLLGLFTSVFKLLYLKLLLHLWRGIIELNATIHYLRSCSSLMEDSHNPALNVR